MSFCDGFGRLPAPSAMKLHSLTASVGILLGLASVAACSGASDDIIMGSDGGGSSSAGTKTSGGAETTTGGHESPGGHSSAGSSSGGEVSGGQAGSGEAGGGSSNGGSSNGGSATGGGSSGGMSAGGVSNGGSGGAPATACEQDEDCTNCDHPTAPATAQQCYCVLCPSTPMSKSQCAANVTQYGKICAALPMACPAVKCAPLPPPVCKNNQCVAK